MVFLLEFESRPPHPKCAMLPGYTIGRYLTLFETVERNKGIEPISSAWKAKAQPLYQFRLIHLYMQSVLLLGRSGIEPVTSLNLLP